jgi:hypothetical protein
MVPGAQPLARLVHALLEPETALPDTFFYDISAWSLPLAYGIEAYRSTGRPERGLRELVAPPEIAGTVIDPGASYAFLASWERNATAKAVSRLLARGIQVHFSTREITVRGRQLPPGSLVIFRDGNPAGLGAILAQVASETAVEVIGVDSGLTEAGPDLGSLHVRPLLDTRIALVAGDPVSPPSLGAAWFLLDRVYEVPHSVIPIGNLTASLLEEFDVLVFPDDGSGGKSYSARVDSATVEVIRRWVTAGGVYVGLAGGAFFAAADRAGLASMKSAPGPGEPPADLADVPVEEMRREGLETRSERERRQRRDSVPGTIFRARADRLHPLAFGYREDLEVMKIGTRALDLGPSGSNAVWFGPKLSGYATEENARHFLDRPYALAEPVGRGYVVLYAEDPNFRAFWPGLHRMFLNALLFLPNLGGG